MLRQRRHHELVVSSKQASAWLLGVASVFKCATGGRAGVERGTRSLLLSTVVVLSMPATGGAHTYCYHHKGARCGSSTAGGIHTCGSLRHRCGGSTAGATHPYGSKHHKGARCSGSTVVVLSTWPQPGLQPECSDLSLRGF